MSGVAHLDIARQIARASNAPVGINGPWQWGTVASVAGNSVNVYLDNDQGVTTALPYLTSYRPAAGDAVLIGRMQGPARTARMVIGTLAPNAPASPLMWTAAGTPGTVIGNSSNGSNTAVKTINLPATLRIQVSAAYSFILEDSQQVTCYITIDGTAQTGFVNYGNGGDAAAGLQTVPLLGTFDLAPGAHTIGWYVSVGGGGSSATLQLYIFNILAGIPGA